MTDVIIIGAGPAGLTAALYAHRAGHSVLVLESAVPGGQAVNTPHVENWPGTISVTGPDFAVNLVEQAKQFQIPIKFEEAVGIIEEKGYKVVETAANRYECRSVILANGLKRRTLNVPGEQGFAGRGVSYCAICDGNFFKGKAVAVIGGGNTAMEDAIYLASVCETVRLVHRREKFRAEEYLVERAKTFQNIHLLLGYTVERISGTDSVTAIELKGTGGNQTIAVSGVFIAVGYEPQNAVFAPLISLDRWGFIQANEDCTTNVPGIFAAGDCRVKEFRQLVTAAADGAIAAGKAGQFLLSGGIK